MDPQPAPDPMSLPWRVGSHVGRTVYAQAGNEASKTDVLIGVMDTPELAARACEGHNHMLWRRRSGMTSPAMAVPGRGA